MVGPIMKMEEAAERYGGCNLGMVGNVYYARSSAGNVRKVSPSDEVYHRGNCDFAVRDYERDAKKASKYGGKKYKIGSGPYSQLTDRKVKGVDQPKYSKKKKSKKK